MKWKASDMDKWPYDILRLHPLSKDYGKPVKLTPAEVKARKKAGTLHAKP